MLIEISKLISPYLQEPVLTHRIEMLNCSYLVAFMISYFSFPFGSMLPPLPYCIFDIILPCTSSSCLEGFVTYFGSFIAANFCTL